MNGGDRVTSDIGPFAMVPEWVIRADISDRAVRLFALLARYTNAEGEAYPSRRTLAQAMNVSRDSVDRAMKELVGLGAVEVEPRLDASGDWTSNLYRLRFARGEVAAPMRPPASAHAATGSRMTAATVAAPMQHRTTAIGTTDKTEEENDASPSAPPPSARLRKVG